MQLNNYNNILSLAGIRNLITFALRPSGSAALEALNLVFINSISFIVNSILLVIDSGLILNKLLIL